jgi:hypothetical protein
MVPDRIRQISIRQRAAIGLVIMDRGKETATKPMAAGTRP